MPLLANLLSDEEIITKAIRSAFPRPGAWLPPQPIVAGGYFPSINGIPIGEVWEIYAYVDVQKTLTDGYGKVIAVNGTIACWLPTNMSMRVGALQSLFGEIGTPGAADTDLLAGSDSSVTYVCMATSGWLLSGGESVHCMTAYIIRTRRRFDLE